MNGNEKIRWKRLASWPLTVSLIYMTAGAAWIAGSDYLAAILAGSFAEGTRFQTIKGTGFVLVTGGILFFLLDRIHTALERSRRNLLRVNGILRVIGAVNRFAAGSADGRGLFETAVREIAGTGEYKAVWMGIDEGQGTLRTAASAVATGDIEEHERIIAAQAMETGNPAFDETGGWFSAAYPLWTTGRPHGALVIRSGEPDSFSGEAGRLLSELANTLSLATGAILEHTARAAAEEELRRQRDYLAQLMEMNPSGIVRFDRDGLVTNINASAERILGFGRNETAAFRYNSPEWGITGPDGDPLSDDEYPFVQAQSAGVPVYDTLYGMVRPDGVRLRVKVDAAPLLDESGAFDGVVASIEDVTTRMDTDDELLETNDILNSLIRSSPVAIAMLDRNGGVLLMNPACEDMFGWTATDIVHGYSPFQMEHEQPKINDLLDRIFSGEVIRGLELERPRRDGSRIMLSITAAPVKNADSAIIAALGMFVDITERKRSENTLQAERNKLRGILDAMDDAICIIGPGNVIEYANPALERLFGPAAGKQCDKYFNLPENECFQGRGNSTSSGRTVHQEWYSDKNGLYFDIHIISIPVEDGAASSLCVLHDITTRREHERELSGIAKFPMENPHPILRVSVDGELMFINPAGKGLADAWGCRVGGPVPRFLAAAVEDAMNRGEPGELEFTADREYTATVVPFPIAGYANVYARNVTVEKQLQARFIQAQKLETIARLAGGVAHDFNNVISAILGYADLALAAMPPDSPGRSDLGEIIRSSEYAAGLTRQLLTFSRRQVVEPRVLDLNAVIGNMNKMLYRLIGEDVQLVTNLTPGLRKVLIDAGQVEQIVTNLAVNARDAMPEGGKLTIGTMNVTFGEDPEPDHQGPPGDYAMIEVRDTGSGIPEEIREHMFEPFFTTKEKGKGTGLGLATIHGIVAQNHGRIWFESESGAGTVFRVMFPSADALPEEKQDETCADSRPEGNETVLVVEDEPIVRRLTARVLRDSGYTVLVANDGEEGLRASEKEDGTIHLLLTDVIMPRMGGRELARRILETRPDIKILYVSGYTDGAIASQGVLEPGINFLQKPFGPAALVKMVRRVLDGGEEQT